MIKTDNRVDLKIHEWTTALTFGVTDWLDVSALIPIENVRMAVGSNATIVNNSNTETHSFQTVAGLCDFPCRTHLFSNVRTASGIGDMIVRVKAVAWRGKKAALALGGDVRFPTGDAMNFIGSGAYSVKPFAAWSYLSRISPHFLVGYEGNGSSQIAGDITAGSKERLPDQFTDATGLDVWITNRLTAAACSACTDEVVIIPVTGGEAGSSRYKIEFTLYSNFDRSHACQDPLASPPPQDSFTVAVTSGPNITGACLETYDLVTAVCLTSVVTSAPVASAAFIDGQSRPTEKCFKERPGLDVMMVLDKSGSMDSPPLGSRGSCGTTPLTKIAALRQAVTDFVSVWNELRISELPSNQTDKLGAVLFSTGANSWTPALLLQA